MFTHRQPLLAGHCRPAANDDSGHWARRTHYCGNLGELELGQRVRVCGWVALRRDHGAVAFINVRDHTGVVQVATSPESSPQAHAAAERLRIEHVVAVEGLVRSRPQGQINTNLKTGSIELAADNIQVLNPVTAGLPFLVTPSDGTTNFITEEVRLRYRHLDLRRPQLNANIRLRHKVVKLMRRFLEEVHDFVEVETPILSRSTPEGARDYLVPARVQPGGFYALPQSPQLFKQMLMVSGFDRYFQFARCFRDEDLRADRQPEFTQLDMELAFTPLDDMLRLNEDLIRLVFQEIKGVQLPNPFPRLTYAEAMTKYGSDKPDTRFCMHIVDVSDIFENSSFLPFANAVKAKEAVKSITVSSPTKWISTSRLKKGDIYQEAVKCGAKGLPFVRVADGGEVEGSAALKSAMSMPETRAQLLRKCAANPGDIIIFANGPSSVVERTLGHLRTFIAESTGLIDEKLHEILWITDFPMFEWNEGQRRLEPLHHPFTAPNPEDMANLKSARALAYDMVYNGVEIGGGSLRIHSRNVQEKVFEASGLNSQEVVGIDDINNNLMNLEVMARLKISSGIFWRHWNLELLLTVGHTRQECCLLIILFVVTYRRNSIWSGPLGYVACRRKINKGCHSFSKDYYSTMLPHEDSFYSHPLTTGGTPFGNRQ